MRRYLFGAAALAALALSVVIPASASTARHHHGFMAPAVCKVLQQRVTNGHFSLRQFARHVDATPTQVLIVTGFCSDPDKVPARLMNYHRFWRPVPSGVRLFGPLG